MKSNPQTTINKMTRKELTAELLRVHFLVLDWKEETKTSTAFDALWDYELRSHLTAE